MASLQIEFVIIDNVVFFAIVNPVRNPDLCDPSTYPGAVSTVEWLGTERDAISNWMNRHFREIR